VADLGDDAAAATETVEVLESYDGPATVAAVTVTYDGSEPSRVIAILDTPSGTRVIATSDDADLAARATTDELIGERFTVAGSGGHAASGPALVMMTQA
jgi:hypothetical protein